MLSAILFDLDGTVVDSDPIHYQVWEEILKGFDITIDDKFYKTRIRSPMFAFPENATNGAGIFPEPASPGCDEAIETPFLYK